MVGRSEPFQLLHAISNLSHMALHGQHWLTYIERGQCADCTHSLIFDKRYILRKLWRSKKWPTVPHPPIYLREMRHIIGDIQQM